MITVYCGVHKTWVLGQLSAIVAVDWPAADNPTCIAACAQLLMALQVNMPKTLPQSNRTALCMKQGTCLTFSTADTFVLVSQNVCLKLHNAYVCRANIQTLNELFQEVGCQALWTQPQFCPG